MWSAFPVFRNCTAASKVEGEQRFSASLSAASSSGANGLEASGNGLLDVTFDWAESDICRYLYVTLADKVNPFLGVPGQGSAPASKHPGYKETEYRRRAGLNARLGQRYDGPSQSGK
jgi:hypothetical protein